MNLSVVVPLYNEEATVRPLYQSIADVLAKMAREAEIIFVDDGSHDGTFDVAERLAMDDKRLRVVKFRRNYGQTPAMAAGIDLAQGRIVVTLDGDLQNDPRDIPLLVSKIEEGFDIVVGWRFDRKDKLFSRRIPSRIANWLIGKVTGVPVKDTGCSLKAFRSEVIKHVPLYSDMHRFIPAMASIAGPRIAEVKVRHHARRHGASKYGLSRIYEVLLYLLTVKTIAGFASRPLTWFAMLAIPALLLASVMLAGSLVVSIFGSTTSMPMAGASLFFTSLGLYLLFGGMLAELINKTGTTHSAKFPLLTAAEIGITRDLSATASLRVLKEQ